MRGPEIAEEERRRDHWSPRLETRRSASWSSFPRLFPDLLEEEEAADSSEKQLSLDPPFESSKPPPSRARSRLIDRIRNGSDMKLDLAALKDFRDADGNESSGDAEIRLQRERLAACNKECSCVSPFLFLSGRSAAQNLTTLQDSRITHIINCCGFVCPEYFPDDFAYRSLWLKDNANEDIMCVLYDVFDLIEKVREQCSARVLLHCSQGVSRSATFVIAYLMWRKNKSFDDAFHEVKSKRDIVSPNVGFVTQLIQWQKKMASPAERESLQIYRIAPHSPEDPLYLVPKYMGSGGIELLDSRGAFVIRHSNMLYTWKGKECDKDMVMAADNAAFQFVRYERAQGPCLLVNEGTELSAFPKVWAAVLESAKPDLDEKQILLYNADYEMYTKAKTGAYISPTIGSGDLIDLRQARDETRSQLCGNPTDLYGWMYA